MAWDVGCVLTAWAAPFGMRSPIGDDVAALLAERGRNIPSLHRRGHDINSIPPREQGSRGDRQNVSVE